MTIPRRGIKLVTRWEVEGGQRRQITTTDVLSYMDSTHLNEHWYSVSEAAMCEGRMNLWVTTDLWLGDRLLEKIKTEQRLLPGEIEELLDAGEVKGFEELDKLHFGHLEELVEKDYGEVIT